MAVESRGLSLVIVQGPVDATPNRADAPAGRRAAMAVPIMVALLAVGCEGGNQPGVVRFGGPTMGASWAVTLVTGAQALDASESEAVRAAITEDLARVNALMSTWDAGSELSRFNRSPSLEPFPVAPETFEVLRWAETIAAETGGAFDITVGPLVNAWGFGVQDDPEARPDEDEIARARGDTGMHLLELDPDGQWVRKRRPDVQCDVSALVPGYAADRIAALLALRGFSNFLVDVGGELVARGRTEDGVPWRVAVERPGASSGRVIERVVSLSDAAVATSGDYRNYHEVDGERVAHILDPRTGRPIRHQLASATVVDSRAVRADALATALMVLGPDEGLALAERLDVAALLLVRRPDGGFDTRASARFDALGVTAPSDPGPR
jgi:thiamine biosynthesis lipoprotein